MCSKSEDEVLAIWRLFRVVYVPVPLDACPTGRDYDMLPEADTHCLQPAVAVKCYIAGRKLKSGKADIEQALILDKQDVTPKSVSSVEPKKR